MSEIIDTSKAIPVPVLGGQECWFYIEDEGEDEAGKADYYAAIKNFLALDESALRAAEQDVYHYYKNFSDAVWEPDDEEYIQIESPEEVWKHVQFGDEIYVQRRDDDNVIYLSIECECDWEEEHGLQIVFKNGQRINKISPYDGHLTNSDAYAVPSLENVIYHSVW
jgi:hypothetical protein